ncbi:MAG: LON peptidase substrate-binding domain-containing protein, partial [Pseudomonas sp.]|uniref:LON peptidase substrate-binding domain-containing protein n=1 Tax=Pseudomonas sp. TaxID=306 RepID=UPI003BB48AC6
MKTILELPLLPLRDVVVYPHMVIPLFVGREKSIEALEAAMAGDKQILLVAQKNPADDDPSEDGLYRVGTVASVLQLLKLPDGTVKVLVEGEQRGVIERFVDAVGYSRAEVQLITETPAEQREAEVFTRSLLSQFEQYVQLGKKVPAEVLASLNGIDDAGRLVDTMAAHMLLKIEQKQEILEIIDLTARVEHVLVLLDTEIDLLQVEKRIRGRVKKQMERSQREYYLNEQMKA